MSQDLISVLLPRVLPAITVGLQDLDDDVRAVAASSLIPVVEGLVQLLPNKVRGAVVMLFIHIHIVFMVKVLNSVCVCVSQVPFIVNTLWDSLLDLDDLTASTNSIMTLLSSLLTYPQVRESRSVSGTSHLMTLSKCSWISATVWRMYKRPGKGEMMTRPWLI